MRYFNYLTEELEEKVFYVPPNSFSNYSEQELLAYAVGIAMYCPATKSTVTEDIINQKHQGLTTLVLDLEDAVGDFEVEQAEVSLVQHIVNIGLCIKLGSFSEAKLPLLFIRVRDDMQLTRLIDKLGENICYITGFVFPKFTPDNGYAYLQKIAQYNETRAVNYPVLYAMPILETASILYRETRMETLLSIKEIVDMHRQYVLNIRIGATDFSSLFGLRRSPDLTIYEIAPIRDCISDIINVFGRMNCPYVISGPVWEYFSNRERVLKPQLRQSPFESSYGSLGKNLRNDLISNYLDGLIKEVMLDKENGIIGKTIIHPSHIIPVQALYAVTQEEYMDATSIIEKNNGTLGVFKSNYANKMNEIKPHLNWAKRILLRSKIYGVLHEQQHYFGLYPEAVHI